MFRSPRLSLALALVALVVVPFTARADCPYPELCGLQVTSTTEQPDLDEAIDVVLVGDGFTTAASWTSVAASAIATFKAQSASGVYGVVPNLYNFHVVTVLSATTDVADTDPADTALGMQVGGASITANQARVNAAALNAPDVDLVIAIANSGSGRANANYPGQLAAGGSVRLSSNASPISHELGHALIHLADEYVEAGLCNTRSELTMLTERNVTADPTCAKFTTTPDAGCVEGARYCSTGIYRSGAGCLMAASGNNPMCPACRRGLRDLLLEKQTGQDLAEPWAVPVSPAAGATVAGTVQLSASLYDDYFSPMTVAFVIDGVFRGRVTTSSTSAQLVFDTTTLVDGPHTLAVFPDDAAGHAGRSTTITFTTQNFTAPTVAVLAVQAPMNGAMVSGTVFISGAVSTGPTPQWLAVTVDGVAVAVVSESRSVSASWPSTPGPHALQLVGVDHTQTRLTSSVVNVTGVVTDGGSGGSGGVQEGGPRVFITAPAAWSAVTQAFLLDYLVQDVTGVEELWVDQQRVMPNPLLASLSLGNGQKRALVNSSAWSLGPHELEVRVGTVRSAPVAVTHVAVGANPTALLVQPAAWAAVRGQVSTSLAGFDDVSVSTLALRVDGAQVGSGAGATATLAWDTTQLADGTHTLVARATDGQGNVGDSPQVSVQVDNTAPQVVITAPRANATVPAGLSPVVFTVVEQGSGVATLEVLVDGVVTGQAPWGTALPVTLAAGGHDLAVQVVDRAGNVTRSATVHVTAANCTAASCNDGDACTTDTCGTSGACLHVEAANCCATATDCDDGDACTADSCGGSSCAHSPIPGCCNFGAGCGDGQLCTTDRCSGVGGTCSHAPAGCCAAAADCNDGNSCTTDTCLAAGWCSHDWNGQCCRTIADCDDGNSCTTDACGGGACTHTATQGCCNTAAECDDGQACTTNQCVNHACAFPPTPGCCATVADCPATNPCQTAACVAGRCQLATTANCCTFDFECDDRNACTVDDCANGACAHVTTCCTQATQCNDQRACTQDGCDVDAGVCVFAPIAGCCTAAADCDDHEVCTTDTCLNGACAATPIAGCCHSAADCNDGNACTVDGCAGTSCTHQNTCCTTSGDCNDGNACTTDGCDAGACVAAPVAGCCHSAADCNDGDPCTVDGCAGTSCTHQNTCCTTSGDCNDGNACTTDGCDAGACVAAPVAGCCHSAADCNDGDPCTVDGCAGTSCTHQNTCCTTSGDCNDGNACTTDGCDAGTCVAAPVAGCCAGNGDCDDGDACTVDTCANATCSHQNTCCHAASDCDDGDACTVDACDAGVCARAPVANCCHAAGDCDDGDACTVERCELGVCASEAVASCCHAASDCDDGDACTVDGCEAGACLNAGVEGCCGSEADCAAGQACTAEHRCEDRVVQPDAPVSGGCGCGSAPAGLVLWLALALRRRQRV